MVYLIYFILTSLFLYFTPIGDLIIQYLYSSLTLKIVSIIGDSLYIIGGGVIAASVFSQGYNILTMLFNGGTILIIVGVSIREISKFFLEKG